MSEKADDLVEVAVRLPHQIIKAALLESRPPRDPEQRKLALAMLLLKSRRRRSKLLPAIRLGEPSWDMLLDLYVATLQNRRVDVTSLCIASGVAPTTAQRYVDLLVEGGHLTKTGDDRDGRRTFVAMSEGLSKALEAWLMDVDNDLVLAGLVEARVRSEQ